MDRNIMSKMYKSRNNNVLKNVQNIRKNEHDRLRNERKDRRTKMFNVARDIPENLKTQNSLPKLADNKRADRNAALLKYKQEKEVINMALKQNKKPPFIVGIPHHGNSPVLKQINKEARKKDKKENVETIKQRRVTRNNTKSDNVNVAKTQLTTVSPVRVFPLNQQKSTFIFHLKNVSGVKRLTSPHTPTVLLRSIRKNKPLDNGGPCNLSRKINMRLENDNLKPSSIPILKQEFTEESAKTKLEITKKNDIDPDVLFQRERVNSESERLLSLAERWETTCLLGNVPQHAVDEIDCLVGQTRLLTNDKFNQFRQLVEQYMTRGSSHTITLDDLNGFWDMVYIQVDSLIKRYNSLEELERNNWEELNPKTPAKIKRRGRSKRNMKTKTVVTVENNSSPGGIHTHTFYNRNAEGNDVNKGYPSEEKIVLVEPVADNFTPRRSTRLLGRSVTPMARVCTTCESPNCTSLKGPLALSAKAADTKSCVVHGSKENSTGKSKRSQKCGTAYVDNTTFTPSFKRRSEDSDKNQGSNQVGKRFVLKPSRLANVINELTIESSNQAVVAAPPKRASARVAARKVTFNTSFDTEKSNPKLPSTPYKTSAYKLELPMDSSSE